MTHRVYRYTTNVPIRHDDSLFRDQTERMFRDMQLRMGDMHSSSAWPTNSSFFELNPRPISIQQLSTPSDLRGSRECLDDKTTGSLFVEDPQTKGRLFRMSFDVKKYDPKEIQVHVEDKCLVVEAKQIDTRGSGKTTSEFSRRIELPSDVEADKLTSTLSSDGILTLEAPCPPKYQSLGATSSGQSLEARHSPITIQHERSSTVSTSQASASGRSPVIIPVMSSTPDNVPLETPVFTTIDGGRRRLDLVVDLGRGYAAKDIIVKVDGRKLHVEAIREEKDHGRVCKTSMQREFDLSEDIDTGTVQAMMKTEGQLAIVATTGPRK